jgi:dolichol kinase
MKWPITKRFKNEKSWGGLLFGFLGGLLAVGLIAIVCHCGVPLVAAPRFEILVIVYAVGVVSASLFELRGGRWDNFIIPAGTTVAMTVAYYALL